MDSGFFFSLEGFAVLEVGFGVCRSVYFLDGFVFGGCSLDAKFSYRSGHVL